MSHADCPHRAAINDKPWLSFPNRAAAAAHEVPANGWAS